MIARRDLFIAAAALVAAGAGVALKQRREVPLLKGEKLGDIVPKAFGAWTSEEMGDPLAVNAPGTLSAKLYNELIVRGYTNAKTGAEIMMLLAYGARQTDDLQLHRPEICYPAFGYQLVRNEPLSLPLGDNVTIPARRLAAEAEGRHESIIYWSRMGEALPQDGGGQRKARLEIAMQGILPDGLLSRFSMVGDHPEDNWPVIQTFVRDLVFAFPPSRRKVLIGTERANRIAASGVKAV